MVGFHKNESLSTNQKLIAGCFSGVITRFTTQPFDIIKLRTQLQKSKQKNMVQTAQRIFFEEGITAFWQGHVLGQLHSILSVSTQFYVYELLTRASAEYLDPDKKSKVLERFLCGLVAGCCSSALANPLEVIRVRQMLIKDQYGGLRKGAMAVYRYGGFLAFCEGLTANCLQMGPQVGINFLVFSYLQPFLIRTIRNCPEGDETCAAVTVQNVVAASAIAGSISGFVAKTITYPFDLTKRRLQIGSHRDNIAKYLVPSTSRHLIKCTNIFQCLRTTYRKEGAKGLFRGWGITTAKAQITSIMAFSSYEFTCYVLRGIQDKK